MNAELLTDALQASVALEDKLSEAGREERQRALRALLQNPLLTAEGSLAAEFGLVRRHADELREWLAHHANWTLHVTTEFARLRKTPPDARRLRPASPRKCRPLTSPIRRVCCTTWAPTTPSAPIASPRSATG